MPSPFHTEQHTYLYQQFISTILPRLVRQSSIDQTYMLCLAPEYPPLMGAMISVAGMQIAPRPSWSVHCAVQSYLYTIVSLQKSLVDTQRAGDDSLLATVILLSVFEVHTVNSWECKKIADDGQACRLDMAPNVAPHTTASGFLLTQRQSQLGTRPTAAAVFDRICIESFIYHASLMMLFEPSLDALSSIRRQLDIPRYFSDVEKREMTLPVQPILQTSYEFFLLIADATKLARISRVLVDEERTLFGHIWGRMLQWNHVDNTDDASLKLYFDALQILLLKSDPRLSNQDKTLRVYESLQHGLHIIPSLETEQYSPSYLLWPLAILGSISIFEEELGVIRNSINLLIQEKRGGQAVWVLKRLNRVWNVTAFCANCPYSEIRLQGLQLLLDAK